MKSANRTVPFLASIAANLACAKGRRSTEHPPERTPFSLTGGASWDNVPSRSAGPRFSAYAVEAPKSFRRVCVLHLLFLAGFMLLLTSSSKAQDVTTWHYDNNRTGWQQNERILNTTNVATNFGKVFQYNVGGAVYAQPLALSGVTGMSACSGSCDVVFIATEEDLLYAFDAASNTQAWIAGPTDLAAEAGGTFVNCGDNPISECMVITHELGVTGTPVIDRAGGILYVVSLVQLSIYPGDAQYFLHAINYLNGNEMPGSPYLINATAAGLAPSAKCLTTAGNSVIGFTASGHIQRAGLLLLSNNVGEAVQDTVYVAFSPVDEEMPNGWLLSYTYNLSAQSFTNPAPSATLNLTPHGSGGGIWMDGAGLAADGSSVSGTFLYVSTANGTFDVSGVANPSNDFGDSLLKLSASTLAAPTASTTTNYFTPADVLTFGGNPSPGRCIHDEDLGSGGVMLLPDSFFTGYPRLMVTADKESKIYVVSRDNLTGFNLPPVGDQIVEEVTTPTPVQPGQGYWGSPAYWEWSNNGTNRAIYYSVDATSADYPDLNTPAPINMYELSSSVGPIGGINASTGTFLFCGHGGEPTTSSNGTTQNTGIVWAIEASNANNMPPTPTCNGIYGPAVLHAFNASSLSSLYTSVGLTLNPPTNFSTPMVFKGLVYMGTKNKNGGSTEVDVFGLCGLAGQPSCFQN